MNRRLLLIVTLTASLVPGAPGLWGKNLLDTRVQHQSWFNTPADATLASPAMAPWRHASSLSEAGASWQQQTSKARQGRFDASSYMWLDSTSVVSGSASYHNGFFHTDGMKESADLDIVGPYTIADEIGGRMRLEDYAFAGSYSSRRGSRLAWGVELGYVAGLSYRHRDPRPRNVTGRLDLSGSVAWLCGSYRLIGEAAWRKYKQTSEIMFVSEQGVPVVYHFTGLGTSYKRFNGVGYNTHYKGSRYQVGVGAFPESGVGFFGSARFAHFGFDYILKDLNRLPMSHMSDNSLSAEVGWRTGRPTDAFAVSASFESHAGDGTENLFGDATTGIYPQIGSIKMYKARSWEAGVKAVWEHPVARATYLSAMVTADYSHATESYLNPVRSSSLDRLDIDARVRVATLAVSRWQLSAQPFANVSRCLDSDLLGLDGDTSAPAVDCVNTFERNRRNITTFGGTLAADHSITDAIAVGMSLSAAHNCLGNYFNATLSFIF